MAKVVLDYPDRPPPHQFRVQQLKMHASAGTHMDSPSHIYPNTTSIAHIPLQYFFTDLIIINVSNRMPLDHLLAFQTQGNNQEQSQNMDILKQCQVQPEDVEDFERQYGRIPSESLVLFYTGWYKHWEHPKFYRNNFMFPTLSAEIVSILLDRNVRGLGIDTLSPDLPNSDFPIHHGMLNAGKYIIENICFSKEIPPVGAYGVSLPIKADSTESPIRLVAMV